MALTGHRDASVPEAARVSRGVVVERARLRQRGRGGEVGQLIPACHVAVLSSRRNTGTVRPGSMTGPKGTRAGQFILHDVRGEESIVERVEATVGRRAWCTCSCGLLFSGIVMAGRAVMVGVPPGVPIRITLIAP